MNPEASCTIRPHVGSPGLIALAFLSACASGRDAPGESDAGDRRVTEEPNHTIIADDATLVWGDGVAWDDDAASLGLDQGVPKADGAGGCSSFSAPVLDPLPLFVYHNTVPVSGTVGQRVAKVWVTVDKARVPAVVQQGHFCANVPLKGNVATPTTLDVSGEDAQGCISAAARANVTRRTFTSANILVGAVPTSQKLDGGKLAALVDGHPGDTVRLVFGPEADDACHFGEAAAEYADLRFILPKPTLIERLIISYPERESDSAHARCWIIVGHPGSAEPGTAVPAPNLAVQDGWKLLASDDVADGTDVNVKFDATMVKEIAVLMVRDGSSTPGKERFVLEEVEAWSALPPASTCPP